MRHPRLIVCGLTPLAAPALCAALLTAAGSWAETPRHDDRGVVSFYPPTPAVEHRTRSLEGSKLPIDLEALHEQFAVGAEIGTEFYSADQLRSIFGIDPDDPDPVVSVMVTLVDDATVDALAAVGFTLTTQIEELLVGFVPVARLARLGLDPSVRTIRSVTVTPGPRPIESAQQLASAQPERSLLPPQFGVTGKGVIVGVIDTGIDFTHGDFRDEHGLSRILAIYDVFDDSWAKSDGQVGTEPPSMVEGGKPLGTVYTQFQINEALLGRGTVNHRDTDGHGTLVAGLAAGNGRGVLAGRDESLGQKYRGLAPDAELLVVRAHNGESFPDFAMIAALEWIVAEARLRNRPVVINMSLGGQGTAKDGTDHVEVVIDRLSGAGKPGVAVVVAAGNEGRRNLHAVGRFGPNRPGQLDVDSVPVEVLVDQRAAINAYFKLGDNFGLAVQGLPLAGRQGPLVTEQGAPQAVYLGNPSGQTLTRARTQNLSEAQMHGFFNQNIVGIVGLASGDVLVRFMLDPGRYLIWGYGAGPQVQHGTASFFLSDYVAGTFGEGAVKSEMVGSPGNAASAITVGSYDFRGRWQNHEGAWVGKNIAGGRISDYSNPGFRRDGVVKPDISAPGRYSISACSSFANVDDNLRADTGVHAAWNGTSASAPYVAGVVAMMLEHNPRLDAEEIRAMLIDTAIEDQFTGSVPNRAWGHGKINPAIAISRAASSAGRGSATASP